MDRHAPAGLAMTVWVGWAAHPEPSLRGGEADEAIHAAAQAGTSLDRRALRAPMTVWVGRGGAAQNRHCEEAQPTKQSIPQPKPAPAWIAAPFGLAMTV
ncbi:hypothetical protein [Inquilinus sp.]|uniref:hypothetical protein n=1 Tax=Inquilinus sp. TaxID=1932117 RepID=UPI0031D67046